MTNQGRESRDRLMVAGVVPILERFAHCALRATKAALSESRLTGVDTRPIPTRPGGGSRFDPDRVHGDILE